MFDSIYIGMSGMEGFTKGLKVIGNNVANLDTPGFKSSGLQFTDALYRQGTASGPAEGGGGERASFGAGLSTLATIVDFQAGDTQPSSNPLDVSIAGDAFLVLQDAASGAQSYTRDGRLQFDQDGVLTSTTTGGYIMGYASDTAAALGHITLDGLRTSPPRATTRVVFGGNVQAGTGTVPDTAVDVTVDDSAGGQHVLHLVLHKRTAAAGAGPDVYDATVTDNSATPAATVETGIVAFDAVGEPVPGQDELTFRYAVPGRDPTTITFDLSSGVTAYSTGDALGAKSQDGYGAGTILKTTFDAEGRLAITYSNGQTATGGQLALARFDSLGLLQEQGRGQFVAPEAAGLELVRPNQDGADAVTASQFEMSNVDLSGEFSNLIVMQRGYQASSNVVSTVNEMLQELFEMRGSR